jgi:hypothetical protein
MPLHNVRGVKREDAVRLRAFHAGVNTLTAVMSTTANPATYPNPKTFAQLDGIDEQCSASAFSLSDGLNLDWDDPEHSYSNTRVRSVVR